MNSAKPCISVIVPVFNVRDYIARCIGSILGQSWSDFELILVDDGSTDGSDGICREFGRRDGRIIVLDGGHRGVSASRNAGLDIARGEYIAFVDGDDILHPHCLETLHEAAVAERLDIALCDYRDVPAADIASLDMTGDVAGGVSLLSEAEMMRRLFSEEAFQPVWGKLYTRKRIGGNRFAPFAMAEDVEFNSRVYAGIARAGIVAPQLYFRTVRPDSVIHSGFARKNIDNVAGYLLSYRNVAARSDLYAGWALRMLYKSILSTRYACPPRYAGEMEEVVQSALAATRDDFVRNRHAGILFRCAVTAFVRCPALYAAFRAVMAAPAAIRRRL